MRRARAGSALNVSIVRYFSTAMALPAVIVAILLSIAWNDNIDRWFDANLRNMLFDILSLSEAYTETYSAEVNADAEQIARTLDQSRNQVELNSEQVETYLTQQAIIRGLLTIYILDPQAQTLARASVGEPITFRQINAQYLASLSAGEASLIETSDGEIGVVRALSAWDAYLFVAREISPYVLTTRRLTDEAIAAFQEIETMRRAATVAYGLLYLDFRLVLLLTAVLAGFAFADRLVRPIGQLITASDEVARGNLNRLLPIEGREGDLDLLKQSFNTMVERLGDQRRNLLLAQDQIDQRRRLTEAILESVPIGVAGVGKDLTLTFVNEHFRTVFGRRHQAVAGRRLDEFLPDIRNRMRGGETFFELSLRHPEGERNFVVNLTPTAPDGDVAVVSVNDVTDLVRAERNAAWSDVARSIAHEIKNPLTPIQLAAERLSRKYGTQMSDDDQAFHTCISTILRQVDNIGHLVNEFASFARMPRARLERHSLARVLHEVVLSTRTSLDDIDIALKLESEDLEAMIDHRLIFQALTNVIKNAAETTEVQANPTAPFRTILLCAYTKGEWVVVDCADDGPGFGEERPRLLEPYFTSREGGVGLGLAIVRKVVEDHGGTIALLDAVDSYEGYSGALVRMTFRRAISERKLEGGPR